MAVITTQVYKSLEAYWHQRTYKKLEDSSKSRKRVVRLGNRQSQRSWKLRAVRPMFRIQVGIPSPMKLLTRFRDAYISGMLGLAGEKKALPPSVVNKGSREETLGQMISKALRSGSVKGDFNKKMMIHIYNSLVAPQESHD